MSEYKLEHLDKKIESVAPDGLSERNGSRSDYSEDELLYEIQRRELVLRERNQDISKKDEEIRQLKAIHEWRRTTLFSLFFFIVAWSIFTWFAVFHLSESVAITLISTTFGQVVGLAIIAFKWMFPKQ